ncbi:MAG: 2-oxo acid dehydrogenase subunit E2, partial [Actinobacteria bacterium]|nr:2-oxo acid dehydrogenase subunit E2 [Actinomycetota bacterium]
MTAKAGSDLRGTDFGANEWLVDELYEQYLTDRSSVDPAWWDFFEDYHKTKLAESGAAGTTPAPSPTTAATPPSPAPEVTPAPATPPAADDAPGNSEIVVEALPATAPYAQAARAAAAHDAPDSSADDVQRLRGPAARVVTNMEASLHVPTATSVRAVPAKLLVDNRIVINNHLARTRGGKISFTHLIGFAVVEALADMPAMNSSYVEQDGKPAVLAPAHVNLGIAIDLAKPDGTRQLMVPAIKKADTLSFAQFWAAYEDVIRRARQGKLEVSDFAGTTISLTNPGTIGTTHSVPRLMPAQGTIVGVGAMEYPSEYAGTSEDRLNAMGISKVLTLTSTYDHRIIQGAQSGDFLRIVGAKLLGA